MATQNSNAPAKNNQKVSIANFLNFPKTQNFLEQNLKENKSEFVSNLIALVSNDTNLSACDPKELMMCAMNATALKLPLNKNLGYAYVIPYKNVPQFQIGYKGLIQLALRTGQYKYLNAVEVRDGELKRNKFTGALTFGQENDEAPIVGYIAYLELTNGFKASFYMTNKQVEAHALKYSKMYAYDKKNSTRKSKWSDPDEFPKMATKTVLKKLLNQYGVLSTEMVKALSEDNDTVEYESGQRVVEDVENVVVQDEPIKKMNI